MNVPQLTPEELKTLQVFAYYCRSNGADDVYTTIYLSACSRDWQDDNWYSNQIRTSIESYDKIDEHDNTLQCTVQYSTVQCTVQSNTVHNTIQYSVQYSTVQYNVQYNTIHCIVQYSTVPYSVQYNAI